MIDATIVQGTRLTGNTGDVLTKTANGAAWLPPAGGSGEGLPGGGNPGDVLVLDENGAPEWTGQGAVPDGAPGQYFKMTEDGPVWGDISASDVLPGVGEPGDILAIDENGDPEWTSRGVIPDGAPGQYFRMTEDGPAWEDISFSGLDVLPFGGLPGAVLSLDENGDPEWTSRGVIPDGAPGQYLRMTNDGPAWEDISFSGAGLLPGDGVPGDMLAIGENGDPEWTSRSVIPDGAPGQYFKMTENGPEWADISFSGAGLLPGDGVPGDMLAIGENGDPEWTSRSVIPDGAPGQYFKMTENGPEWADISFSGAGLLPGDGVPGDMLAIGENGDPEWTSRGQVPDGAPGQYLRMTEDGPMWEDISFSGIGALPIGGLPGAILALDESGEPEWTNNAVIPDGAPGQYFKMTENGPEWADISFSGAGLLPGDGVPGDVLAIDENGDPEWTSRGQVLDGAPGQYLRMTEDGPAWEDISFSGFDVLPSGGVPGQFLAMGYDGPEWEDISVNGVAADMSDYYDRTEVDLLLAAKQPLLPAGNAGQFLQKTASGYTWTTAAALSGGVEVVDNVATLGALWENDRSVRGTTKWYLCNGSNTTPSTNELTAGHLYQVYFMLDESDPADPFANMLAGNGQSSSPVLDPSIGSWGRLEWRLLMSTTSDTNADGWYRVDTETGELTSRLDGAYKAVYVPAADEVYIVEAANAEAWAAATDIGTVGALDRAGLGLPLSAFYVNHIVGAEQWMPNAARVTAPLIPTALTSAELRLFGVVVGVVVVETENNVNIIPIKALDLTMLGDLYLGDIYETLSAHEASMLALQERLTALEAFHFGTLTVSYTGTAPAGSGWSIDGGTTWNNFGKRVMLEPDEYTVEFKDVEGYDTPADQTATVTVGQPTAITADPYVEEVSYPASYTLSTTASGLSGTYTMVPDTFTTYNGTQYPIYQNGSYYLAIRDSGRPFINTSLASEDQYGWRLSTYTPGTAMSTQTLSGSWYSNIDDDDAAFTFTE